MTAITTIDVRGLDHEGKESQIFPGLEALEAGQTLRIVIDFNPTPLTYLLTAQEGKYDLAYEKEGPDEWVLRVTRLAAPDNPRGATAMELKDSFCNLHLDAIRDSLVAKQVRMQPPHPVNTFMQEHVIILDNLRLIGEIVARLKKADSFEAVKDDLDQMEEAAGELVEAELHHDREEQALFPALEKHGVGEPPRVMTEDHVEFRRKKQALYQLARQRGSLDFETFKARAVELGDFLTRELETHIFKEDNIVYQIALQLLTPQDWDEVKRKCDDLGYCCFTPDDQERKPAEKAAGMTTDELDLRPLPPPQRHKLIFERWEALPPGGTLRITNDHDPKPLRYQFEAEYTGTFEWQYEKQGPVDWVVAIRKTR